MGGRRKGRIGHGKFRGATHRHPSPGVPLRGRSSLPPLFPDQPTSHALSGVPCARLVYFHRRGRGRVQGSHRHAAQTRRNALDRSRFQRHHRSPLCQAQWSLSGLLGAQIRTQGRMTHHFLGVHPARPLPHPSFRTERSPSCGYILVTMPPIPSAGLKLPKGTLKKLSLGQSFAEYDKLLERDNVYVETPGLRAALDDGQGKCFFVGRRGTGKTAITPYLEKKVPGKVLFSRGKGL